MKKPEVVLLGRSIVKSKKQKMKDLSDQQSRFGIDVIKFNTEESPEPLPELSYDRDETD